MKNDTIVKNSQNLSSTHCFDFGKYLVNNPLFQVESEFTNNVVRQQFQYRLDENKNS